MVVYQRGEKGLGELGFHQLHCIVRFYTSIRVVDSVATSYYGQKNKQDCKWNHTWEFVPQQLLSTRALIQSPTQIP